MNSNKPSGLYRLSLSALLLLLLTTFCAVGQDSEEDPVLEYYWNKACKQMLHIDSLIANSTYSLTVQSFYHKVNSEGEIIRTDTLEAIRFYSGTTLDSQTIISGNPKRFEKLNLIPFNIYKQYYHLNMFPNDTGGIDLPIGITSESTNPSQPDGLFIMDRYEYNARWLYLNYIDKPGYRRFTKSFRFTNMDGLVFPDSVWEVATINGIFSSENYRLETGITDIEILQ